MESNNKPYKTEQEKRIYYQGFTDGLNTLDQKKNNDEQFWFCEGYKGGKLEAECRFYAKKEELIAKIKEILLHKIKVVGVITDEEYTNALATDGMILKAILDGILPILGMVGDPEKLEKDDLKILEGLGDNNVNK